MIVTSPSFLQKVASIKLVSSFAFQLRIVTLFIIYSLVSQVVFQQFPKCDVSEDVILEEDIILICVVCDQNMHLRL
jgi:hypothetical protein